ncbi:hypothetical protein [Mycolicibacterium iranicum]|uniref:Uncharacterized protein n=1 Tax=Mycolicibacterium iranicum TaxID=912594 RepID=A0ABT4HEZ5_MYCIR|nr:hypothetical protein [Mycolicibacterium iranicum]MCZ0728776.1 hypothetical protein [Mycolicibacterium iranicum]
MTRGKGIYDDEEGSTASISVDTEKDPEKDAPDVDKDADEPTA